MNLHSNMKDICQNWLKLKEIFIKVQNQTSLTKFKTMLKKKFRMMFDIEKSS